MKYYSEKLNKLFDSETELFEKEDAYMKQKAEEEEKKKRAAEEKEAIIKEIDDTAKKLKELIDTYNKDYNGDLHIRLIDRKTISPFVSLFDFLESTLA